METFIKLQFRKSLRILVLGFIISLMACGGAKTTNEGMANLRELVNSRQFEIENQWANPTSGSRVNLIGNNNFLRFNGDNVDIFLPYFGVRHAGGNYGGRDGGIIYKGPVKDLNIVEEENKIEMRFRGEKDSEDLQFFVILYPNGNSHVVVNSSQRTSISYQGEIDDLPEDVM